MKNLFLVSSLLCASLLASSIARAADDDRISAIPMDCLFPQASDDALILGMDAYTSETLSTSYVGDQDQETTLVDVFIEEGASPLYLLLTSYDQRIWRFTGNVERVERVIASAARGSGFGSSAGTTEFSHVGIVGIAEDRVHITTNYCLPTVSRLDSRREWPGRVMSYTGRELDFVFRDYDPFGVSLPSGLIVQEPEESITAPAGFDPAEWDDAIQAWSGGFSMIEPSQVVSPTTVGRYEVLPGALGFAQLVGSGAVERIPSNIAPYRYIVREDIPRVPVASPNAILLLNKGVSVPPGDLGHGCILALQDGVDPTSQFCPRPPPPSPAARTGS